MNTLNLCSSLSRFALGTCLLISALFAIPAAANSDSDIGVDNAIELFNQGDNNQVMLEQAGELNSLNLLIQANNVSANIFQQGSSNLVAGVNGSQAFTLSGHNSVLDIVQTGTGNQVFGMQMSANSVISVTQLGHSNIATIIQR